MSKLRQQPIRMRLDKWLSHMGVASRSELRTMAKRGMIRVNGDIVKDSGRQVTPGLDRVECNGEQIEYAEHVYIMLNKPVGVLSATEDKKDRTVLDLLPERYLQAGLFPVGRLDKDTTGLLMLTNDGDMAHRLLSPKRHVPKTYRAIVTGHVQPEVIASFENGVTLEDGYVTLPGQLKVLNEDAIPGNNCPTDLLVSHTEIIIREGKYHQIKRMFQAHGHTVIQLHRIQMGPLQLDATLQNGEFRFLLPEEIEQLEAVTFPQEGALAHGE